MKIVCCSIVTCPGSLYFQWWSGSDLFHGIHEIGIQCHSGILWFFGLIKERITANLYVHVFKLALQIPQDKLCSFKDNSTWPVHILKLPPVSKCFKSIQDRFVTTPIDKAGNNIIIVSKIIVLH